MGDYGRVEADSEMKLTIRPLTPDDWKWLDREKEKPDRRGVESKGAYAYVALDAKGKPVGVTLGLADMGGGDTAILGYVRAFDGLWTTMLALLWRQAQNGIDTGHKFAIASVPMDNRRQCTNVAATADLTAGLSQRVGLQWEPEGTKRGIVAYQKTQPVPLAAFVALCAAYLKSQGVEVEFI